MRTIQQELDEAAACQRAGRVPEAIAACRRVLQAKPRHHDVLSRVGQSLCALGASADAEHSFQLAVELFPNDPASHRNLGSFFAMNDRMDKAEGCFRRAAALNPNDTETWNFLLKVLAALGLADDAAAICHDLQAPAPDDPAVLKLCAETLMALFRYDDAIHLLSRALEQPHDNGWAWGPLANALYATGRYDEHVALAEKWLAQRKTGMPLDHELLMSLFVNPGISVAEEARLIPAFLGGMNRPHAAPAPRARGARITIGYLSGYLEQSNYMGFLEDVIAHRDRERFNVKLYSDGQAGGPTGPVRNVTALDNAALAALIRADKVDVLVDMNGFALPGRLGLLAMKPAPVSVSWFNAFSSLGFDGVDYLIADEIVVPPKEDEYYKERIWRLSGSYLVRAVEREAPPVAETPALRNGFCTFGTLGAASKIHARSFETWGAILNRVPNSRFVFRNAGVNEGLAAHYRARFAEHGVDPSRIDVLGPAGHVEFLASYGLIDIALDTFPWNGGTTTMEALWQGVPVVTFRGDRWVSRVGETVLRAIGRPEWMAEDLDGYLEMAVALAQSAEELGALRLGLRQQMEASLLCDAAGFARKWEAALTEMLELAEAGHAAG